MTFGPDTLWDLGFRSLTRSQVTDVLNELMDTLELRVGTRLSEALDSNQLARFERIVDGRDEASALAWLQQNIPNYREVVRNEYDYILDALRAVNRLSKHAKSGRTSQEPPMREMSEGSLDG